jgi:hypothetical protein
MRLGSFGIGTFLTNDFHKASSPTEKSKALNMVIKLNSVNEKPCVKISDDFTKVRVHLMHEYIITYTDLLFAEYGRPGDGEDGQGNIWVTHFIDYGGGDLASESVVP